MIGGQGCGEGDDGRCEEGLAVGRDPCASKATASRALLIGDDRRQMWGWRRGIGEEADSEVVCRGGGIHVVDECTRAVDCDAFGHIHHCPSLRAALFDSGDTRPPVLKSLS